MACNAAMVFGAMQIWKRIPYEWRTIRLLVIRNRWEEIAGMVGAEKEDVPTLVYETRKLIPQIPPYEIDEWFKWRFPEFSIDEAQDARLYHVYYWIFKAGEKARIEELDHEQSRHGWNLNGDEMADWEDSARFFIEDANSDWTRVKVGELAFFMPTGDDVSTHPLVHNAWSGGYGVFGHGFQRRLNRPVSKYPDDAIGINGIVYSRLSVGQGITGEDVAAAASTFVAAYTVCNKVADPAVSAIVGAFAAIAAWAVSATNRWENIDKKCAEYRQIWNKTKKDEWAKLTKKDWTAMLYKSRGTKEVAMQVFEAIAMVVRDAKQRS